MEDRVSNLTCENLNLKQEMTEHIKNIGELKENFRF